MWARPASSIFLWREIKAQILDPRFTDTEYSLSESTELGPEKEQAERGRESGDWGRKSEWESCTRKGMSVGVKESEMRREVEREWERDGDKQEKDRVRWEREKQIGHIFVIRNEHQHFKLVVFIDKFLNRKVN